MSLGMMALVLIALDEQIGQHVAVSDMARSFAVGDEQVRDAVSRLALDPASRVSCGFNGDGEVVSACLAPKDGETALEVL